LIAVYDACALLGGQSRGALEWGILAADAAIAVACESFDGRWEVPGPWLAGASDAGGAAVGSTTLRCGTTDRTLLQISSLSATVRACVDQLTVEGRPR
jgi:hypothetical protein